MLHGYRQLYILQKTEDIYSDITKDVEIRFETSTDELDRPLPKGKNKKVICLMKDELGGAIMKEFIALRANTYIYLTDNNNENKKAKGRKKCVVEWKLKFKYYKHLLEATQKEKKILVWIKLKKIINNS